MTCQTDYRKPINIAELTAVLSNYTPICEPEFDDEYQELERQFAEFRCNFNHD